MIRIIELHPHGERVESHLDTPAAAARRLRMLERHNPHTTYRIDHPKPKVTVTPIPNYRPKVTVERIPA